MDRKYMQNILSNLLEKRIEGKKALGVKELEEINKSMRGKMESFQDMLKKGKIANKFLELVVPGASKVTEPLIAPILKEYSGIKDIPEEYDLSPEDRVFGIGELYDTQKEAMSDELRKKYTLTDALSKSGKAFLGEDFVDAWKKGEDIKNVDIEGLSMLDQLFSSVGFFKEGGVVPKYQEGGTIDELYAGSNKVVEEGKTYNVPSGRTYKRWSGFEYYNEPYWDQYKIIDGEPTKVNSKVKLSSNATSPFASLADLQAAPLKQDVRDAGKYLDEETGLYKRDKSTEELVGEAKAGSDSALSQLAMIAIAQNPTLKEKSFSVLKEEIKFKLPMVNIDLEGQPFQDIESVYGEARETLGSTLAGRKESLGDEMAQLYNPNVSKREKRLGKQSISSDLSNIYSDYGAGMGRAQRAKTEAIDSATATEFSVLDQILGG